MAGSSFGRHFRITNWGESHGPAIGTVVDGCPPRLELAAADIQRELDRRRPGQSALTTPRAEPDQVQILSGVFRGRTTGTPISLLIPSTNVISQDYAEIAHAYRPGHADFTYQAKYGIRDPFGGGRSSARVTAGIVAAGAIAQKLLREQAGITVTSYVKRLGPILAETDPETVHREMVERSPVRCPDPASAERMMALIRETAARQDSVGGIVECIIRNVPPGLGDPIFDKLDADLAKAMLAINASKGFELGSGFACATMTGSQHNDPFELRDGRVATRTNHAGGILGGISTGMPIVFRVAFKPTASIGRPQHTLTEDGQPTVLQTKGRHDPSVLPRAVPVVDAMAALVILDHFLALTGFAGRPPPPATQA
ncbi:MAG: chorismate synthase [Lentisphaeria bacterium]|jgi:chorismate synthase